jgi:hypothetical protein
MRYSLQEKAMRMRDARFPRWYEASLRAKTLRSMGLGEEGEHLGFRVRGVLKAAGWIVYFKGVYDPIRLLQRLGQEEEQEEEEQ